MQNVELNIKNSETKEETIWFVEEKRLRILPCTSEVRYNKNKSIGEKIWLTIF